MIPDDGVTNSQGKTRDHTDLNINFITSQKVEISAGEVSAHSVF